MLRDTDTGSTKINGGQKVHVEEPPARRPRRTSPLTRFPGLLADADALGVHRTHLYLVLSGQRVSESLLRRYRALKAGQKPAG